MRVRGLKAIPSILVAAAFWVSCGDVRGAEAEWWNQEWSYRLVVRVPPAERCGGINTARLDLAEQSALCAEGGRDVRVLDGSGTTVSHEIEVAEDGNIELQFLVPAGAELFCVYYGNPEAPAVEHRWEKQLGGLTLETRAMPRKANQARAIPAYLAQNLPSFGKEPWGQINDLQNPFGRDDRYLSIYEGTIYCPEDGRYTFAANADDLASFHLYMGQTELLRCWRDAGVPSEQWQDSKHRNAVKTTRRLLRGVYAVRYYHIENDGAQLAKLGWREPSSDAIVTVPPRAFVRYLPAEIEGRQRRGEALNPFFVARHRYNLEVNSETLRFPCHRFESRSGEPANTASSLSYHWDFGDGETATGRVVDHEFPSMASYNVTLSVRDPAGTEARVTRHVSHPPEPVKRMTLHMQAAFEGETPLLPARGVARLQLFLKNDSSVLRPVVLETVEERESGGEKTTTSESEDVEGLEPSAMEHDGWLSVRKEIPLPEGNLYVTFRLVVHGKVVIEKKLAVLSTVRALAELTQDRAHNLYDSSGRLVVLRLADATLSALAPRRICDRETGEVRMIVIDEGLGGPMRPDSDSNYVPLLVRALSERYPGLTFRVRRPAIRTGEEYLPIHRFLEIRRHTLWEDPHLVILVCQPESVINTVPPAAFEGYLVAAADQILSQTRAHLILVTPPPLPGRPELSRTYARIAKKTGLRKGLLVADLYSRFLLSEGWEDLFRPPGSQRPSYLLFPNQEGQLLVSREICLAIVGGLDGHLAAAARDLGRARRHAEP